MRRPSDLLVTRLGRHQNIQHGLARLQGIFRHFVRHFLLLEDLPEGLLGRLRGRLAVVDGHDLTASAILASRGCSFPDLRSASISAIWSGVQRVTRRMYAPIALSGTDITFPYISSGVESSGIWLPRHLAHLDLAIRAGQNAQDDGNVGLVAQEGHDFPGRRDNIEELVGTAHLHIRLQGMRIIALHDGIESLVQVDRVAVVPALAEIIACDELLDREIGGQFDQLGKSQSGQPFRVEADLGLVPVQDLDMPVRRMSGR